MELFAKIVNSLILFVKSSILDVWQGFKYTFKLFYAKSKNWTQKAFLAIIHLVRMQNFPKN